MERAKMPIDFSSPQDHIGHRIGILAHSNTFAATLILDRLKREPGLWALFRTSRTSIWACKRRGFGFGLAGQLAYTQPGLWALFRARRIINGP